MNDLNVKEMDRAELKRLVRQANQQIRNIESQEKRKTIKSTDEGIVRIANNIRQLADETKVNRTDALSAIAANMRVKLSNVAGQKAGLSTSSKGAGTVKFRDPNNPSKTWAGSGRLPNWLKAELDKGKTLEDFRV